MSKSDQPDLPTAALKDAVRSAALERGGKMSRRKVELNHRARQVASQFTVNAISPHALATGVRLSEFVLLIAASLAVYVFYVVPQDGWAPHYPLVIIAMAALSVVGIQTGDGYQVQALRGRFSTLSRIVLTLSLVFGFLALLAFFSRTAEEFSRVWFASAFGVSLVTLLMFRAGLSLLVRRWFQDGRLERRAVILGGGEAAAELLSALEAQPDNDIRVCGIFDDRKNDRSPAMVAGYPKLGTIAELVEFGRQTKIDMLIVSLPLTAESRVLELLKRVWVLPVDIRLSAHSNKLRFRPRSYSYVGAVPFLDVFDKPIADWDSVLKRGFDILFSLLGIVLFAPVMAAAALAIKLDSKGPVLFRQQRYGFNNEVIEVLKFRSMYVEQEDKMAAKSVTRDDPRVTKVGRFIRRTSIDELPQFFNVLRGNLSLVGPRPHAVNAHVKEQLWDEVVDGYFGRHKVKPGVTGWAQINGWRGEVTDEMKIRNRVEHDLYYIENWSVLFDLYILLLTPFKLFSSENAY